MKNHVQRSHDFAGEVLELIGSADQHCSVKLPGAIGILRTIKRITINTWITGERKSKLAVNLRTSPALCHLNGIGAGWNVADHKPTAPPWGRVGVTGMDEQSVMDLFRRVQDPDSVTLHYALFTWV